MYIIGISKIDKEGRVIITGLFGEKKTKKVLAVVDVKYEAILLLPLEEDKELKFGTPLSVDEKNRIVLPKWIREELGEKVTELSLAFEDDKHYLIPKTRPIL